MESLLLEHLREEYRRGELDETHCDSNPIEQFRAWMEQARSARLKEPNAMTLATATGDGRPSARIVLLKELTTHGFIFYTNYGSRKARDCDSNPNVALTFYWAELERQVRVEGTISKVSPEKSEAYFRVRPRGSRLGALASDQSTIVESREVLERKLKDLELQYRETDDIPMPPHWGGYLVLPAAVEFWQGRANRLHDRLLYTKLPSREPEWSLVRLSP